MKKIVIAQFWTKNLPYSSYTEKINSTYAAKKGYQYYVETDESKIHSKIEGSALTWYKPFLISEVFDVFNPDYVLFLDADAIVADDTYNIEQFIDENYDIICTEDYGPSLLNAGVLLLKNSEWTKNFLKTWWETGLTLEGGNGVKGFYKNALWHDQTCFGHLITNLPESRQHIKIIDNRVLNGRYFKDLTNKNFIFHAFSYGQHPYRTLDLCYYELFNIPKPTGTQLLDIVNYYKTDKHHGHNYISLIYNELFKDIYLDVKKFMEIGVYEGDSILLWRDYFVNAEIIGVEYNLPYSLRALGDNSLERITLVDSDQSDTEKLEILSQQYTDLDVILDDGSHKMRDQQITFAKLFKSLKPGGIFIIEDLHTSLEAVLSDKQVFNWGDNQKTLTLDMLKAYKETGKIYSDYMTTDEMDYLNNNIESVEIYQSRPDWSITSVIRKK